MLKKKYIYKVRQNQQGMNWYDAADPTSSRWKFQQILLQLGLPAEQYERWNQSPKVTLIFHP